MKHTYLTNQLLSLSRADQETDVADRINQARIWIANAGQVTELLPALQFNSLVVAIEKTARQLGLSKEVRSDAQEVVRRSERCVGVAVRNAQDEGTLTGQDSSRTLGTGGKRRGHQSTTTSIGDVIPRGRSRTETYAITDGVSDERFEQAIAEARAEGCLSRANVARKARVGEHPGTDARSKRSPKCRAPRPDYLVVLHKTAASLQGITVALEPITALPDAVTAVEAGRLAADLNRSIRTLVRIKKLLIEEHAR